jgi:NAD(P)-dependent dehydrogenase (short-subunit alcohol dehydrogenase family)
MSFTIDLEGRRALVTGSGQGVGRSIALMLADAGAVVAVNDIERSRAESVVDEIASAGGKAVALPFDVTDWASVSSAIDGHGGVDILVNNAGNAGAEGFSAMVPFAETDPADWPRYFNVNLFGTMHATRAALPSMVEGNWGRVVNIVSDAGRYGDARLAPYAAAKAGAAGFARSVAREVGRHNITVNNIALGTMETPVTSENDSSDEAQARLKEVLKAYVVRRRGQPDEVAGLVTYLSGPLADWITGQTYLLNGGYTFSL